MTNDTNNNNFPADNTFTSGVLYHVPMTLLTADPGQPRQLFDAEPLAEMSVSIKQHGVIQPITFRKDPDGKLIIISGERRFRASQIAKQVTIPAIYHDGDNHAEIALVENLHRVDLSPIEEAEALHKVKVARGYKDKELSDVIGKAASTISEILSLNKLPEEIKTICKKESRFSRRVLIEVVKIGTEDGMLTAFEKLKNKGVQRDELRDERMKPSHAELMLKKVKTLHKAVKRADFNNFGVELEKIESELTELVTLIQSKVQKK